MKLKNEQNNNRWLSLGIVGAAAMISVPRIN